MFASYNTLIPQHKPLLERQVSEKQSLKKLRYVRNFTYLGAANITSKQKSGMTKVAIKNENITSFGGIYIIFLWFFILPHWFGWGIL